MTSISIAMCGHNGYPACVYSAIHSWTVFLVAVEHSQGESRRFTAAVGLALAYVLQRLDC